MAICESKTSTTQSMPKWVSEGSKDAFKKIERFSDKGPSKYTGELVAGLTPQQQAGIQGAQNYYNQGGPDPNVYGDVSDIFRSVAGAGYNQDAMSRVQAGADMPTDATGRALVTNAASAPADQNATDMILSSGNERIVDENGQLGAISDYMNPYLRQILDPALREIDKGAAAERARIGDLATSGGAYGDARHGVLEGELGQRTDVARGDVTGGIYKGGFDTAMNLRSGDLNRRLAAGQSLGGLQETALNRQMQGGSTLANLAEAYAGRQMAGGATMADISETALGRQMQAGGALSDAADAEQARTLSRLQALLSAGAIDQQTAQNQLDASYAEWQRQKTDQYDRMQLLLSGINGVPYQRTTTSTQPDNTLASLLGGVGGALLPG